MELPVLPPWILPLPLFPPTRLFLSDTFVTHRHTDTLTRAHTPLAFHSLPLPSRQTLHHVPLSHSVRLSLPPLGRPRARTARPPVIKGAHSPSSLPPHPPLAFLLPAQSTMPLAILSSTNTQPDPYPFTHTFRVEDVEKGALKLGEEYLNGFFHQASNHSISTYS